MPFHFRDLFKGSTGPTPLDHRTSAQRPPLRSPRPVLLPRRCRGLLSWCSSGLCWFSTLRQGPVAEAMASRKTCHAIYKDTSDAGWTLNYVTVGTNKKLKYKGHMMLKEGKAKKVELHESGKQCPNFPTNSWIFRFSFAMRTRWDVPQ